MTMYSTDDRYADDVHYTGRLRPRARHVPGPPRCSPGRAAAGPAARGRQVARAMAGAARKTLTPSMDCSSTGGATATGSTAPSARTSRRSAPVRSRQLAGRVHERRCRAVRRALVPAQGNDRAVGALYPEEALPGPSIGFLQECLRWFRPLAEGRRERRHGRADAPRLDAGLGGAAAVYVDVRDAGSPRGVALAPVEPRRFAIGREESSTSPARRSRSATRRPVLGREAGVWCAWKARIRPTPARPATRRRRLATFTRTRSTNRSEMLGFPEAVRARGRPPDALVAVRLCDVSRTARRSRQRAAFST